MKQKNQHNTIQAMEMVPTSSSSYFVSKSAGQPEGQFDYNEEITRRILKTPSQRRTASEKTIQSLIIPGNQKAFDLNRRTYTLGSRQENRSRETPLYQEVRTLLSSNLSSPEGLNQLHHQYPPNDIAFFQILQQQFADQKINKEEQILRGLNHLSPTAYEGHTVTIYRPYQLETQDERKILLNRSGPLDSGSYHQETITMYCPKNSLSDQQRQDIADLFTGNCSQFRVSLVNESGTEVSARLSHPVPENRIQSKDDELIGPALKEVYGHTPSSIYTYENGEYLLTQDNEPREFSYGAFREESWDQYLISQRNPDTGESKILYDYGNIKPYWSTIKQQIGYLSKVRNDGKSEIQVQKLTINPQDIFHLSGQDKKGTIVHLPDGQEIDPKERRETIEQISLQDFRQSQPQTRWVLVSHNLSVEDPFDSRTPLKEWTEEPASEDIRDRVIQVMKEDDELDHYRPDQTVEEERRKNTNYSVYAVSYDPQMEQLGQDHQAGTIVSKYNPEYVHRNYVWNQKPIWRMHHHDAYELLQSVRKEAKEKETKEVQFAGADKPVTKAQAVHNSQKRKDQPDKPNQREENRT